MGPEKLLVRFRHFVQVGESKNRILSLMKNESKCLQGFRSFHWEFARLHFRKSGVGMKICWTTQKISNFTPHSGARNGGVDASDKVIPARRHLAMVCNSLNVMTS